VATRPDNCGALSSLPLPLPLELALSVLAVIVGCHVLLALLSTSAVGGRSAGRNRRHTMNTTNAMMQMLPNVAPMTMPMIAPSESGDAGDEWMRSSSLVVTDVDVDVIAPLSVALVLVVLTGGSVRTAFIVVDLTTTAVTSDVDADNATAVTAIDIVSAVIAGVGIDVPTGVAASVFGDVDVVG